MTLIFLQYKKKLLIIYLHHFKIGLNKQYGSYVYFWYWTLIIDPNTNTVKLEK